MFVLRQFEVIRDGSLHKCREVVVQNIPMTDCAREHRRKTLICFLGARENGRKSKSVPCQGWVKGHCRPCLNVVSQGPSLYCHALGSVTRQSRLRRH